MATARRTHIINLKNHNDMTDFDIRRFGRTLRWTALTARKEIINVGSLMFFALMLPFALFMISAGRQSLPDRISSFDITLGFEVYFICIIISISGCWIFSNLKTKEQRIAFKMLPASDLEKFLSRAVYVVVVWPLMAFIAFCLADLLRMGVSLILGIDIVRCAIPDLLRMSFGGGGVFPVTADELFGGHTEPVAWAFVACSYWIYSLYVLGGAFFRRRPLVLTLCSMALLCLLFLVLFVSLADNFMHVSLITYIEPGAWTCFAIFTLLTALDWWLSYVLFRRLQVINNKWINL